MRHDTFLGNCGVTVLFSWGYQVLHILTIAILVWMVPQGSELPPDQYPTSVLISEGRPILVRRSGNDVIYRSPDGRPLTVQDGQPYSAGAQLAARSTDRTDVSSVWTANLFWNLRNYSEPWYFIREPVGAEIMGYFVAYSGRTRQPVLYLGVNGQSPTVPSPKERFRLVHNWQNVMGDHQQPLPTHSEGEVGEQTRGITVMSKTGLHHLNLGKRRVSTIVPSTKLIRIAGLRSERFSQASQGLDYGYGHDVVNPLLLRDDDAVTQISHGKVERSYLIPELLRERAFTAYPADPQTIYYAMSLDEPQDGLYPARDLLKCDSTGKTLQRWSIGQPPRPDKYAHLNRDYLCIAAAFPTPLQIAGALYFVNSEMGIVRAELARHIWPSFVVVLLCGILSVIAAGKLTPRFSGSPAQWGWLVYVFVLGVPGLVGYLLHFRHRRRPVLEPAPALGTEVFA